MAILDLLVERGVRFAILHRSDEIASGSHDSDIDIVVNEKPDDLIRHLWPDLTAAGVEPAIRWPYDAGGTRTYFLVSKDARLGIQLDLMYDRNGVGKYGVRSAAFFDRLDSSGRWPRPHPDDQLVYLIRKRIVKGETDRLDVLAADSRRRPREVTYAADRLLTDSVRSSVARVLSGEQPMKSRRWDRLAPNTVRLARRVTNPIGAWAHSSDQSAANEVASRFQGLLPHAKSAAVPDRGSIRWFASQVAPVRWGPGVYVSWGDAPGFPSPDLVITATSGDGAAGELTAFLTSRVHGQVDSEL